MKIISAYKFITIAATKLPLWREQLLDFCLEQGLKGTILISEEGINIMLAGKVSAIDAFKQFITTDELFKDLFFKESTIDVIPFKRMFVKIKKEIITFGVPTINPEKSTAEYLSPQQLHEWYATQRDMVILDTRNDYEVAAGKFNDAIHLNIENFSDFPAAVNQLDDSLKQKTIVTYCTGGIRCEKAAAYLVQLGFRNVYQLHGGIINYFAECGNDYYEGDCFVFDERERIGKA